MGKCLKPAILFLACTLMLACANKKNSSKTVAHELQTRPESSASLSEEHIQAGKKLLNHVQTALGTPYVRGGANRGGFDCSGLVSWAFKNVGIEVPRTAREQSLIGQKIINIEDMREGDIVAFRHPKRGYHTGIYVGEGLFIHSPRKRTRVRVNSLSDPYFSTTLLGARRIDLGGNEEDLVAQAKSQLAQMVALEQSSASTSSKSKSKAGVKANSKTNSKNLLKDAKAKSRSSLVAANNRAKTSENTRSAKLTGQNADKNSRKANDKAVSMLQRKAQKSTRAKVNPS